MSTVSVYHTSSSQPLLTTENGDILAEGKKKVVEFLQGVNQYLRALSQGEDVSSFGNNYNESMSHLHLKCRVPFFQQEIEGIQFVLMDTMGVNEAFHSNREPTLRLLSVADVLVFIFDISNILSRDEQIWLSEVVAMRPDIVTSGRMFFLLNKIDMVRPDLVDSTIETATVSLRNFLGRISPDFESASRQIHPVALRSYLLAMKARAGTLDPGEDNLLQRLLSGRRVGQQNEGSYEDDLQSLIDDSRYEPVEEMIRNSITLEAPRIYTQAILAKLYHIVDSMHKQCTVRIRSLEASEQEASVVITSLEQAIESAGGLAEQLYDLLHHAAEEIKNNFISVEDMSAQLVNSIQEPSTRDFPTTEAVDEEVKSAKAHTEVSIRSLITVFQARMRSEIERKFVTLRGEIQHLAEDCIRQAIVNSLRDVMPQDELAALEENLRSSCLWPSDWLDISMIDESLESLELELSATEVTREEEKDDVKLIPAEYGTRPVAAAPSPEDGARPLPIVNLCQGMQPHDIRKPDAGPRFGFPDRSQRLHPLPHGHGHGHPQGHVHGHGHGHRGGRPHGHRHGHGHPQGHVHGHGRGHRGGRPHGRGGRGSRGSEAHRGGGSGGQQNTSLMGELAYAAVPTIVDGIFDLARRYVSKPPTEKFVTKEAHLEHTTKTVSTTMYQCDLSAFRSQVEEQVQEMAKQVRQGLEEYLDRMLAYIEDTIHEDFASQLGETVKSLTTDLNERKQSSHETEQLLERLKKLNDAMNLLRIHLSKNPEEAVRTPLPDLEF